MPSLTDRARIEVAKAYAERDIEALRSYALAAIADLETAIRAYDSHLAEHYPAVTA